MAVATMEYYILHPLLTQLGHATMQMVLTDYSKWIKGADKNNEHGKIDSMFVGIATKMSSNKATTIQQIDLSGRGERIRTSDHVHPMHVRYQAALRPEGADYTEGAALITNHSRDARQASPQYAQLMPAMICLRT